MRLMDLKQVTFTSSTSPSSLPAHLLLFPFTYAQESCPAFQVKALLEGPSSLDDVPRTPLVIESFSSGFQGNGCASRGEIANQVNASIKAALHVQLGSANHSAKDLPGTTSQQAVQQSDSSSVDVCPTCGLPVEVFYKSEAFCAGCQQGIVLLVLQKATLCGKPKPFELL